MSFRTVPAVLAIFLVGVSAPLTQADETSRRSIVSEIFDVMEYGNVIEQTADVVASQIVDQVKTKRPDLDAGTEFDIREVVRESFLGLKPEMMTFTEHLMSRHFTEEELQAMLAFYKTEAGRKTIQVMPQIVQETTIWVQPAVKKIVPQIMERVRALLQEEGTRAAG